MRTTSVWLAGSAVAVAALSLSALGATPAAAQDVDARWLPWVGCWEKVGAPADDPMLCVRPGTDGVELLTVSRGEIRETRALRADGVERATEEEGCTGTERAGFSSRADRLYMSTDLDCGNRIGRESSRMWAMLSPTTWIDIRAVDVEGQGASWIDRYRVASSARVEAAGLADLTAGRIAAIEAARVSASAPISTDDVIEAYAAVGAEAVKAWIAERGDPIRLDADRLVQLADAGVPAEVIDVAVAVSYPERFAVAQEPRGEAARSGRRIPLYLDPWGYGYPYSMFGYDPYGYGALGRYGYFGYPYGYGGYGPTIVVVRPVQSDNSEASSRHGRMVKGRGYTQRGSGTVTGSGVPSSGSVRPATRSTGSSGASTPSSGSSGSKRTAKPRGGGH